VPAVLLIKLLKDSKNSLSRVVSGPKSRRAVNETKHIKGAEQEN